MNQLVEFFTKLFDSSDWPPRWHCGRWTEFHGWLYIISDLLVWSAYFTIPIVIIRYISKKQGIQFIRLYFLFAAFILACGATHFFDAVAFWIPLYRVNALVRLITGALSWTTVFYLVKFLPVLFSLKSQKELEFEIDQRKKAENETRQLNETLEQRIIERTAALAGSLKEVSDYKLALDESSIVAITDQKGIIKHANQNFCNISKYSVEELIGQDHRIINSGYHSKEFIKELWATIGSGKIWKGELKNKAKDGTIYWVDTTIVPFLDEKAKPYQYVAISADITQRKQTEEEIKMLNEELEKRVNERTEELVIANRDLRIAGEQFKEVNKELESFSYSVSHDLRAPLRAVHGYTEMLKANLETQPDPEAHRLMNNIMSNAKKMGQLIDDLLNFARIGRKELVKTNLQMQPVVTEICNGLKNEQGDRNIEYLIGELLPAQADSITIRHVWQNLISNAIKYSQFKDKSVIEIGSEIKGNEIIYHIKDNGAGFDMRYAGKLFGVFQRLHSDEEFEGTGVGLALVQRIIVKHGGRIWAEGQVNKGATFFFTLNSIAQ